MRAFSLILVSLIGLIYVNATQNYMMCAQNLLGSLDMLKVMGNHIKDNNPQALQASVMGFAFDLSMLIKSCDIKFDTNFEKQEFNEKECMRNTRAFYSQIKPLMENPQDILFDLSVLDGALSNFGKVLGSCGVGLNDSRNQAVEEMIEKAGDIDMDSLLSLMSQFSNQPSLSVPNLRGQGQKISM